jgi:hypothetical protein
MSTVLPPWPDVELVFLDLLEPVAATVIATDEDLRPPLIEVHLRRPWGP